MAAKIKIVYMPDNQAIKERIPRIDAIQNPYKPSEKIVLDVIVGEEGPEEGLMFFEAPDLVAREILAEPWLYKLWEPATFKMPLPGEYGSTKMVELKSVKPGPKAEVPVPEPTVLGSKKKTAEELAAAAAAAAVA
jgi:hypothetical protein